MTPGYINKLKATSTAEDLRKRSYSNKSSITKSVNASVKIAISENREISFGSVLAQISPFYNSNG